MSKSKLTNGYIPARTVCPFKKECGGTICHHTGTKHRVDFSCGLARAFDIALKEKPDECKRP